jgi:PPOX class probable FMN-dependent enzyme
MWKTRSQRRRQQFIDSPLWQDRKVLNQQKLPTETMTAYPAHRLTSKIINSEEQLRALIGNPAELTCAKVSNRLNPMTRLFIERSPFMCIATSDLAGNCDLSPRGDPVGFVRIIDDRTLLVPERPGNRLADSLRNILANPHVGLLFIVPGVTETFRVNGRATVTVDTDLLTPCTVEGKPPALGVLVDIDEAYTQCSKAFLRSHLWDPQHFVDPTTMPTGGQVRRAIQGEGFDAEEFDREREERYGRRVGFY